MASSKLTRVTNAPAADPGSGTNDIHPLKPALEIPSGWEWLWWLLGIMACAIAAFYLWRYLKRRAAQKVKDEVVLEPPHLKAKRRMEAALQLLSDPKAFCTEVSDALRMYLEERFQLRAPERTTEEFLNDLRRTDTLNASQKLSLAAFLEECDLVKFARMEPTEEALRRLLESALRLVEETAYDALPFRPDHPQAQNIDSKIADQKSVDK